MMPRFFFARMRLAAAVVVAAVAMAGEPLYAQDEVQAPAPEQPAVTSPLVERLLGETFDTPGDRLNAVLVMIDAKHGFAARPLVEQLLASQLDDQQLAALERRFGGSSILKLAAEPQLQPEARQLALDILAAARRQASDPARLATLVDQLRSDSRGHQRAAIIELRRAGPAAGAPLLAALAEEPAAADQSRILTALLALGEDARGPLTATLDSPDAALRIAALKALGALGEFDTVPFMLGSLYGTQADPAERDAAAKAIERIAGGVPNIDQALHLLKQRIDALHRAALLDVAVVEVPHDVWRWDETAAAPVVVQVDQSLATTMELSRVAGIAVELDPEDPALRRSYLGAALEVAALGAANDTQAVALLERFGIDALDDVLRHSIDGPYLAGATLAAQLLGEHGTDALIYRDAPEQSPLVMAADGAGDRRLRFAAVEAIMKLNPQRTYPGRSEVIEALAYFVSGYGRPRAVVATTNPAHGFRLSSYLSQLGFVTETYGHPGNLVRRALADGDCQFALIDVGFVHMTANDAISQLRADARTEKMPIGVVSSALLEPKAQRLVDRYPLVGVVLDVDNAETVAEQVERIRNLAGPRRVTQELRQNQALAAIGSLLRLSVDDHPQDMARIEDVVVTAMDDAEMAATAISILQSVGTPLAQQRLVEVASQTSRPIAIRQQAAAAFTNNVLDHGTLLTSEEILRQYDRYNNSRHEDAETQRVLASILDAIEVRSDPIPATTEAVLQLHEATEARP